MPTAPGQPIYANGANGNAQRLAQDAAPAWRTDMHPVNWYDWNGSEALGISPQSAMRGKPVTMAWWQRRAIPVTPTMPQPVPWLFHSRPYNRGAQAFAPQFGTLPISPIGAGIYNPYKLPVIAGPGARYQFGAIWFDVQSVPTSVRINPTMPIETLNALIATSHVGPSYLTTG